MKATTISDFRANIRQYVDSVINDACPILISRGNDAAVVIPLDKYNSIVETEKVMLSPVSLTLDDGLKELKSTKGRIQVSIDEL